MGPVSWLSLVGILISLVAVPFAWRKGEGRWALFLLLLLLVLHIASSVAYYLISFEDGTDSQLYYFDPFRMVNREFEFGTVFLVKLLQWLKDRIGGTYFDYFMLFQAVGFWGILILWRIVEQIHVELGVKRATVSYFIFFLPSLHFWTSAIGKDAPLFFAVSLAGWATLRLGRRLPAFALAVIVMVLFRPHIALMAIAALAIAVVFDRRLNILIKASLAMTAVIALGYVAATIQSTFGVNVGDAESVSDFFASRQAIGMQDWGSTAVYDANFLVKLLSLLFRPLFFDASGYLALVASMENVLLILIFGSIFLRLGRTARLVRRVRFVRFAALLSSAVLLALTLVYYNVGLGARQRVMVLPMVLSIFVAQWALSRRRKMIKEQLAAELPNATPERTEDAGARPMPA